MVDTPRDKTAIAALFADNTTGNISPQDLRDFMESVHPAHGSYYVTTPVPTTLTQNVWTKALGVTTDINLHRFDGAAALGSPSTYNRLVYTGTPDIHLHGVVSFSSNIGAGSNEIIEYAAYHWDDSAGSGQILDQSIMARNHSGTDVGTGAIHFDIMMETNDWIEFHIRNTSASDDVLIDNLYVFLMGMFT